MKVQHFLLTGIAVAVLSACGSDNTRTVPDTRIEPVEATVERAGRVIKDDLIAVSNIAQVHFDLDGDMVADEGEPVSPIAEDGSYKLTIKESDLGKGKLVANLGNDFYLTSPKDSGIVSALTTMLDQIHFWNAETSVEAATVKMKALYRLTENPDVDFETLLASPSTSKERKLALAHSKDVDSVIRAVLKKFTKTSIESAEGYSISEVHKTILYYMSTDSGLELIKKAKKLHAEHSTHASMDFDSWSRDMQTLIPVEPSQMTKLIPLTQALLAAVDGNPAQYFSTDGYNSLSYGDPDGEEHAPAHSSFHYDAESKETHLANYYLKYDSGNGYFRTTSEAELENHFVLNTTTRTWQNQKMDWNIEDFNLDTGKLVLQNPDNPFVSTTVLSKVADIEGQPIDMYLSEFPALKKTWGHLVDDEAIFSEGSKVHRLTLVNNKQVFVLPEVNGCEWDAPDVKFAKVGDIKRCNFMLKYRDGEMSQSLSFDDLFVDEFANLESSVNVNVDGAIAGRAGSSFLIAQLVRTEADDKSGNMKFFKNYYIRNESGELVRKVELFPTSTATTWSIQTIGVGNDAIELFRVTMPKEVTSFGREMQMPRNVFAVVQGEGENRALRRGMVMEAGQVIPANPKGLNIAAIDSILASINIDKFKTHDHEWFKAAEICYNGNSLMKDRRKKLAYAHSMKTRDEYHLAAKRCTPREIEAFTITDVAEKILTLSKYDEDALRKIRFEAATGNTGDAKVYKDIGGSLLYKYDATYVFDADSSSVKVSFTDPENGNKHHIHLSLIKRVKDEAGKVKKHHFKTLHLIDDATKGVVEQKVYKVEDLPEPLV